RYSGEFWDNSAHLQYLRARWYDPSVGRFMSQDTNEVDINNPLSLNLYTYVHNNPLRYTDPSGHEIYGEGCYGPCYMGYNSTPQIYSDITTGILKTWEVAGSLAVDDINTIADPNVSTFDKTLAAAGFIPVGKVITGGKIVVKLASKGREIERTAEYTADNWKALKNIGCNCFTAGTKVLTDEGEKNIEDIKVGDKVLSKDETTGEVAYKEVTATFNHETDEIYNIHVSDQTIEATFNHPFYVKDKGWTFVKDLKAGDLLVQSDGNTIKVNSIELERKHAIVYNMTVDEFHTYFVSDLGIWVHNTNCPLNTVVEEKNVTNQLKSLSTKQQESFENIKTQLASGDYTGLNVHALTGDKKGLMSADFKGFGQGRGNARIYFKIEDGKVNITEIDLKHQK
ncbi:polymorphic toxin-type HINT domain-containing protein, partial [Paenibacillus elgii]